MNERRGVYGWVARRPQLAIWLVGLSALFAGTGFGAAVASNPVAADEASADAARFQAKASDVSGELARVTEERDALKAKVEDLGSRADVAEEAVEKLSAKGEVPDFIGDDVDTARGHDLVSRLDWKIRTVRKVTASAKPGTVIGQRPREGKVLKTGRSITLTVARKPPPKPKQWVTIQTLQGDSSTKTEEFRVPSGAKARLVYDMPQDSNNAITLYKAPKEYVDLLLNEIGPQSGSTRLYERGTFYLDVMGAYNIQVQVFKRPS